MDFKTKYNLNDKVWFMKDNKPTEVKISAIEIFYVNTNQDTIKYNAKDCTNPKTWLDHTNLNESNLFPTKELLIQSL